MKPFYSPVLKQVATTTIRNYSVLSPLRFQFSPRWSQGTRDNKSHLKRDQTEAEVQEQAKFDKNQERLEKMEHDSKYHNWKAPNDEQLKKTGDDARIEQYKADDGVY